MLMLMLGIALGVVAALKKDVVLAKFAALKAKLMAKLHPLDAPAAPIAPEVPAAVVAPVEPPAPPAA